MKSMSKKDDGESQLMHSKCDNREIMIGVGTKKIVEQLFNLLLHKYQGYPEQLMKVSNFVYNGGDGLFCKCHKIILNKSKR